MKYTEYAKAFNCKDDVIVWIDANLQNYLKKNEENQTDIEHILDYLCSDARPKRIAKMSYKEALSNAEKWSKSLQKKASGIDEEEDDTETVLDFRDGFKIVKLVGRNAYDREGMLMRHCVSSYYGKDTEVYSLRDKDNMPHCTIEKDKQIKGKGNGSISPKYIKYVVEFLEHIGMEVRDNEMKNLGYVNIEKVKNDFDFMPTFRSKYFYKDDILKVKNKDDMRLWNIFGLFTIKKHETSFNFDLSLSIKKHISRTKAKDYIAARDYSTVAALDSSTVAARNYSTVAARNSSTVAARNSSTVAARSYSTVAALDSSTVAARNYSTVAALDSSTVAALDYSTVAARDYSTVAARNYSTVAALDSSTVAARNSSTVAARNYSTVAGGKDCVIVARANSKAKGLMRSVITLCETNNFGEITNFVSFQIDGDKYKEDTFYHIKNGKITEFKG